MAVGADFLLLGPQRTMLTTSHPVIAVSGLRTGLWHVADIAQVTTHHPGETVARMAMSWW